MAQYALLQSKCLIVEKYGFLIIGIPVEDLQKALIVNLSFIPLALCHFCFKDNLSFEYI